MNVRTSLTALAAGAAAVLVLSGCSGAAGDTGGADGPLRVVATTTQLTDFAHQVGGDDIELTGLLTAGASAHHFDPSPADLLALGEADVLIVNGAGLETFVDSAVEASGFSGTIIDASQGIDLAEAKAITAEAGGAGDDHEHEGESAEEHAEHDEAEEDHADHDHADDDHAADDHADEEHDHDHGDVNPHIWTSPRLAQGMVHEIADGLGEADPANADAFEERAHAYMDRLAALDTWIAAQFERVPEADRVLVSGHDSLRYFLHDYDIAFAGSLLPSFEDNAEPSAAEIDAIVAAIREQGVKAIFVESSMSPKLAQAVADEAGVTVVDASALYTDSLGTEAGTDTYIGATIHNTVTILEAWGVTPDPLPAELEGL